MIQELESIESYNKDPVNQQGPTKSEANGKEGRGNFAVDGIDATTEPQVPKPRTKKPGGERKKKGEKNLLARSGLRQMRSFLATPAREALANSHSLTSSES
jgi:hypothetical protein